jgi:hypothetical protein
MASDVKAFIHDGYLEEDPGYFPLYCWAPGGHGRSFIVLPDGSTAYSGWSLREMEQVFSHVDIDKHEKYLSSEQLAWIAKHFI